MSRLVAVVIAGLVIAIVSSAMAAEGRRGTFEGRVVAEWLDDGRSMRLREPFAFVEPNQTAWRVPSGAVVDGASIPAVFWSVIGAPFSDHYRNASVIHDHYCDVRTRTSDDVHRVFYEAMLASGVKEATAWLMYQAVLRFGPRWSDPGHPVVCQRVNGKIDWGKCASNKAVEPPAIEQPKLSKDDLGRFLDDVAGKANAEDLRKLREAASKVGN